jgi:hypothetical protein
MFADRRKLADAAAERFPPEEPGAPDESITVALDEGVTSEQPLRDAQ